MDKHEDPEIGEVEKVTRFGCGALLGIIFGFYLVIKYAFSSFASTACIIIVAICVCGYLSLKYGDKFWYAIFGRDR